MAAAAQTVSEPAASVLTGRRLGAYQVHERIGVGGMGEVYRARDTRLGRDVAIKILPRLFTSDPDRLARFEREARVLASLNHPHIGAIYGWKTRTACARWCSSWSTARRWPTACARTHAVPMRSPLRDRSPKRSTLRTRRGSFTGISSRRISRSHRTATVKVLDFGLAEVVVTMTDRPSDAGADDHDRRHARRHHDRHRRLHEP